MNRRSFLKGTIAVAALPFIGFKVIESEAQLPIGNREEILQAYVKRFEAKFASVEDAEIGDARFWSFGLVHKDPVALIHTFGKSLFSADALIYYKPEGIMMVMGEVKKNPHTLIWADRPALDSWYRCKLCKPHEVCGRFHPKTGEPLEPKHDYTPEMWHSVYCRFRIG